MLFRRYIINHLTIGKERNLGQRMKDLREIGVRGTTIAHVAMEHCIRESTLHILFAPSFKIEFVLQVIDVIFFFIPVHSGTPLETFETGFALRTHLVSLFALVLVACPANGKRALVASNKKLSFCS
jgi:hypothetical protein